jgi:hypothetical protein
MHDEIKVTVIATGFDSAVQAVQPKPIAYEAQQVANGSPIYIPQDTAAEDLNVPTFIRRQAD